MALKDLLAATELFTERVFAQVGDALNVANIHDINPIQAVLLRRLGGEEATVGHLTLQQCYIGKNVSYNVKSLLKSGYLAARSGPTDTRLRLVRATKKGLTISRLVEEVETKCLDHLASYRISVSFLEDLTMSLVRATRVLS